MDRREFMAKMAKLGFVASAGAGLGTTFTWVPEAAAKNKPDPTLAVAQGTDHAALVDRAVKARGGMERYVKKGAKVVVKPNMAWDQKPQFAANTNPVVVKRVVELCLAAGAAEVLVCDRPVNHPESTYVNSGIQAAVRSIGDKRAKCEYMDERRFITLGLKHGKKLNRWSFYEPILKADTFINVPIAKDHGSSRLTLSLKNMMGAVGGDRGRLHWGLHQCIADLNTVLKADLIVMDGTRILVSGGPTGGDLSAVKAMNTIVAGQDPVAVDAYSTRWFNLTPDDVSHIRIAARMGLGEIDLKKVKVIAA